MRRDTSENDETLARAVARTATVLAATAEGTPIIENRLQAELAGALRAEGAAQPVTTEAPSKLKDWPNVGGFDIRIADEAVLELKWWGKATSKRYESLWDACKIANAVAEDVVWAAYLVAGGHDAIWGKDDGYTALFESGEHDTLALCISSANFFTSPANDRTTVTAGLLTTSVAEASFDLHGEPYTIRAARVAPFGERVRVPPYVAPRSKATTVNTPRDLPLDVRVERFAATLLGGALGDALGAPVEFASLGEIRHRFGDDGIQELAPAYGHLAAITDDTQMTLFTAEGLLRAHNRWLGKGIAHIPSVVRHAYSRWLHTQGVQEAWRSFFDERPEHWPDGWLVSLGELHDRRAPGNTCLAGAASARMGTMSEPLNDSKGCGAVMRAAPVGLAPIDDPFTLGCEIGALTHGHPNGYLAAGALALFVRRLVCDVTLDDALNEVLARLREEPHSEECVTALERARQLGTGAPTPEGIEQLGGGWVAEEALAIAVCCTLATEDFVAGVRLAANHSGDSDSTAAIAGNLLGARIGRSGLPKAWLDKLELRDAIEQLATDLARHHERPEVRGPFDASMGDEERYPGG